MMRDAGWGRVINIASAHGLRASPFKSAYVTAKHGVVGMTKVVALETAKEPHHRKRHLSRLCPDADGRKANPSNGEGIRDLGG